MDANGCTDTLTTTITEPTPLLVNDSIVNIICYGDNNGQVVITPTGSTPNYTISWLSGPSTGPCQLPVNQTVTGALTYSGMCPGQYDVLVTDANGCTDTSTITIIEPLLLNVSISSSNVLCYGDTTGTASVTILGGTPGYSIYWTSNNGFIPPMDSTLSIIGDTTGGQLGISAGTYFVGVMDANGCIDSAQVSITQPTTPVIASITHTDELCFPTPSLASSGTLTITASGGFGPYNVSGINNSYSGTISASAGSITFTGVSTGIYSFDIQDANGCPLNSIILVDTVSSPTPLLVNDSIVNIICYGDNNGQVVITPTGATPNYTISWLSGPSTGPCQLPVNQTVTGALTYSGMCPGQYDVLVTDANGCTDTSTITIIEPLLLNVSISSSNVLCYGDTTGTASVTILGGTPGYSIYWTSNNGFIPPMDSTLSIIGDTTGGQLGISAGTYFVGVMDANGCIDSAQVSITQPTTPVIASITHTDELCFPTPSLASSGTLTITASGGFGPYNVSGINNSYSGTISASAGSITFTGVSTGIYSFDIQDANGCPLNSIILVDTVSSPTLLTIASSVNNILCYGANNGNITVTPNGGTAPYTYNWISGPSTGPCSLPISTTSNNSVSSGNSLCPGQYVIEVVDSHGCVTSIQDTVNQPSPVTLTPSQINVLCYNDSTGIAGVVAVGGTPSYIYSWVSSNGFVITPNNTASISNIPNGVYTVTVQDQNYASGLLIGDAAGCIESISITILEPPTPLQLSLYASPVVCHNQTNGYVTVSAIGGSAGYDFYIGPINSNQLLGSTTIQNATLQHNNLVAGQYAYYVKDLNGCTDTSTIWVTQPLPISITGIVIDDSCDASCDGIVDLTVNGGNGFFSYIWNSQPQSVFPLVGDSISGLCAGVYNVLVTDFKGCSDSISFTVNQQPNFTLAAIPTNNICYGSFQGAINVAINGGTPNFVFNWQGPNSFSSSLQTIYNLGAGQYDLVVTDGNNCTNSLSVNITEPGTPLQISENHGNVACFGDSTGYINIGVSGGTPYVVGPIYAITWTANGISQNILANSLSLSNLPVGQYTFIIQDSLLCATYDTINITQPPAAISFNYTTSNLSCFGDIDGAINITVSGGTGAPYSFLWSNGATTEDISNLTAGSYSVIITDAGPCQFISPNIQLIQPTQIVIQPTITNVSCHGDSSGMISTQVSGGTPNILTGYDYLWTTTTGFIPIGQDTLPNIGSPGHPNGLIPGNYALTVTDDAGCTSTITATVIQPNAPLYVDLSYLNVDCYGDSSGSIQLIMEGGTAPYNVSWVGTVGGNPFGYEVTQDPGTYLISNLSVGTYQTTITDQYGCVYENNTVVITQNSQIDTLNTVIKNISCNDMSDGLISLEVLGGSPYTTTGALAYSYSWISFNGSTFTITNSGNQTSISGLSAGAYQLTVIDSLGCEKVFNYIITEPDSLTIDGLVFTNAKCKGECSATISFDPSGGTPDYTVYLFGVPIGPAIDSVIISANEAANNADSIYTFDSICPGNYLLYLMDANNCNIYTQTIIQISEPQTVFNAVSSVLSNSGCNDNDGQIQVTASGGSIPYNVSWQNLASMNTISPPLNEISQTPGSYLIDSLSTATYLIYVIDANGCLRSDTLEIDSSSVLFAGFTAIDTVGCGPFEVQFTNLSVGQNLSYFWSFGNGQTSTSSNPIVVFQTGGPYDVSLTVTNLFGCSSTFINTGYIVAYGNPTAAFTTGAGEIDYYSGFVQFINNSTNASSYVWNFGDGSQTSNAVNPSYVYDEWQAATYLVSLTATDTNGCSDIASLIIESQEIVRLTVPNSFTINDDNLNDMFKPVFSNYDLITSYSFDIYNRWGERIYSSNDVFDAWDGKYKDKLVQFGTYTWVITYRDQRAFDINVNGHVTVLSIEP